MSNGEQNIIVCFPIRFCLCKSVKDYIVYGYWLRENIQSVIRCDREDLSTIQYNDKGYYFIFPRAFFPAKFT